jgi:hypothetical protein
MLLLPFELRWNEERSNRRACAAGDPSGNFCVPCESAQNLPALRGGIAV